MIVAVVIGCIGEAAGDPRGGAEPDWFWTFSKSDLRATTRATDWFWSFPNAGGKARERGPEWFWSHSEEEAQKLRRRSERLLLFSGADLWRQGAFLYGGMLWTSAGLDRDGLAFKLMSTGGLYRYHSGALGTVIGVMTAASAMPGMRFTHGGVSAGIYAGLDYQVHRLSPDDPGNAARGRQAGVRVAIDLWYQPTQQTMTAASATLSTIAGAYAVRAAAGWRIFDLLYLGPEALLYGGSDYRQWRIGLHVTGLNLAWFEMQAAAGYAVDDDDYCGPYLRFGVNRRW